MKHLDIIFMVPITDQDPEQKAQQDTVTHEINNIFNLMYDQYIKESSPYFEPDDKPAIIEIFGTDEQRMEMIKMYVDEDGNLPGSDMSDIIDPNAPHLSQFFPDKVAPPQDDVSKFLSEYDTLEDK